MDEVIEGGRSVGFSCRQCFSITLNDRKECVLCGKTATLLRRGKDERCSECTTAYLEVMRKLGHHNVAGFANLSLRYNYACPFCLVATDWANMGIVSRCTTCKADGTNRMQICHSCSQINFVYPNRGEYCADCVAAGMY